MARKSLLWDSVGKTIFLLCHTVRRKGLGNRLERTDKSMASKQGR